MTTVVLVAIVSQLGHPDFKTREKMSVALKHMINDATIDVIMRLPTPNPEARLRIRLAIQTYWSPPEDWQDMPTIDMKYPQGEGRYEYLHDPYYLQSLDCASRHPYCRRSYPDFRYATYMMVCDMYAQKVPKTKIRELINTMWEKEKVWDSEHHRHNEVYPNYQLIK